MGGEVSAIESFLAYSLRASGLFTDSVYAYEELVGQASKTTDSTLGCTAAAATAAAKDRSHG